MKKIYEMYHEEYSENVAAQLTVAHAIAELTEAIKGVPLNGREGKPKYHVELQGVEIAKSECDSPEEAERLIEETIREKWEHRVTTREDYEIVEVKE